jgi:DNA-binding NarL/FixJ family response regulator
VKLTPQQTKVIETVQRFESMPLNRQIAELTGLKLNAVKFHLFKIFKKYQVKTRKELFRELKGNPERELIGG